MSLAAHLTNANVDYSVLPEQSDNDLVCGADFKCHNDPRVEGEACGPGATCGAGLKCLALVQRCIRTGSEEALAERHLFNVLLRQDNIGFK
eukprot:scaffold26859_cov59-Cyclotella_meneghiniana.AAC.3